MLDKERIPSGLLTETDELRRLIIENPELPLVIMAGQYCNNGDWYYMSCGCCRAELGEVLDCMQEVNDEKVYSDRDDFREDLEYCYDDFEGSDQEFEKLITTELAKYEPYWKKCIFLYVDN